MFGQLLKLKFPPEWVTSVCDCSIEGSWLDRNSKSCTLCQVKPIKFAISKSNFSEPCMVMHLIGLLWSASNFHTLTRRSLRWSGKMCTAGSLRRWTKEKVTFNILSRHWIGSVCEVFAHFLVVLSFYKLLEINIKTNRGLSSSKFFEWASPYMVQ